RRAAGGAPGAAAVWSDGPASPGGRAALRPARPGGSDRLQSALRSRQRQSRARLPAPRLSRAAGRRDRSIRCVPAPRAGAGAAGSARCRAMESCSLTLGAACEVGYGMRTGNNARHVGRREPQLGEIGLIGGEDIVPYGLRWRPKTLRDPSPLARLVDRQLGSERVAVQRIRTNALVPWARWLEASVVGGDRVCLDSLSTLRCGDPERLWAL